MKIIFFIAAAIVFSLQLQAQNNYWVMLTDKAGTTFDPYSYFDQKAIERYQLNNADLYDISNYPLNESYVGQIDAIVTDDFGQSRWFNAVAVTATPDQIAALRKLPFVKDVVMLESNMHLAKAEDSEPIDLTGLFSEGAPADQLIRMGRDNFRNAGIDGKGVRIAVFDGGFPQVNTHIAFKHLRDEGRIIKTWNFPNKKEDVYGWNSHGLMTLSCIAGIHRYQDEDGEVRVDIGMATGAEFLLARTEIEAEPFKEEVWWQMAVEWADKNGAQIISSSLGYGKDRYYTKDMNGQSYVAKAGNMAARKGILVCNSAGNEGTDNSWLTIITPSDADSVLCVGGISNSLTEYEHISFSSYGPSADGRQKPNVVAFGHAYTANTGSSNDKYHFVDGTSFSCPLVAGFAACALQAKPGLTAMQLFHEIEKSADLYPYCDYTYGYGVPQAGYFTGNSKKAAPTFKFVKDGGNVNLVPLKSYDNCRIFIKSSTPDGTIHNYKKLELKDFNTESYIEITSGEIITAQLDGYVESYNLNNGDYMSVMYVGMTGDQYDETDELHFSQSLKEKKSLTERYFMLGVPVNISADELEHNFWSPAKRIGIRKTHYFTKGYGWGFALEYGHTSLRFGDEANRLDTLVAMDDYVRWLDKEVTKHKLNLGELGIEIYQRVRLRPGGIFHKGWHWDIGVYGNWSYNAYTLKGERNGDIVASRKQTVRNLDLLDGYRWNWGVTTRLTRDWLGIYARYRLNDFNKDVPVGSFILPQLEAGLQLSF
ncbi:MAG: S8 family serine peptidase [Bacteroidales bacterium]|nr:S8 family serine peptidase [Bacteroidales bacterium]